MRVKKLIAAALLAAGHLGWVSAQQSTPQSSQSTPLPPVFRVSSDLVLIDFVASKGGALVTDLGEDEIEVLEDGKKQKIRYFQAIDLTVPWVETERKTERDIFPAPRPESALFAILIDLGRLGIESRRFVIPAVKEVLGSVAPGDRIMLATMGRSGLTIRLPFTKNIPEVIAAAEEALLSQDLRQRREGPDDGFYNRAAENDKFITKGPVPREKAQTSTDPADADLPPIAAASLRGIEYKERQEAELRQVADAAKSIELLVRSLGGLPGRKNVVLVSEGYNLEKEGASQGQSPVTDFGGSWKRFQDVGDIASVDFNAEMRVAIAEANRSQVSFYTIDPRGVGADDDTRALHTELARDTGGVAIFGSNDLTRGFKRAYDESRRYYRVVYVPQRPLTPGKSHRLMLKSKRKGVDLRHRNEVVEPDPKEAEERDVANALAFPELFQEFAFDLEPEVTETGLTLHLRIPRQQIEFREGDSHAAEVAFYAQVTDAKGTPLQEELPLAKTYNLSFTDSEFNRLDVLTADHPLTLKLAPGTYRVSVAIRQAWAQRTAARTATIEIR